MHEHNDDDDQTTRKGDDPFEGIFAPDGGLDVDAVSRRLGGLVELLRNHEPCFVLRIDFDVLARVLLSPAGADLRASDGEEEFEDIVLTYGKKSFPSSGLEYTDDLKLNTGEGCDECNNTGYKGRMGIHELMAGTPEVKLLIKRAAPTEDLFSQASRNGMTTLMQDGIMKVFQGLTDMNELRRVVVG